MKKLVCLMSMTIILACTKYEKIEDFPIEPPRLVSNCIFYDGEPFVFSISRSLSVLDNALITHITDAQVVVFRNQNAIDTIKGANEGIYYRSPLIPEQGYNYHIMVSHPRYETIYSVKETLPLPLYIKSLQCVMIDSVTGLYSRWNSNLTDTVVMSYVLDCSLIIRDPGIGENFYSLEIVKWDSVNGFEGGEWARRFANILVSDDPSLMNLSGIGTDRIKTDRLFFNNHSFAGTEYVFKFTIDDGNDWGGFVSTLNRKYILNVYSYTHSSYMYARTRRYGGFGPPSPFDEPYSVYSNIEGGYGIFAGIEVKMIPLGR